MASWSETITDRFEQRALAGEDVRRGAADDLAVDHEEHRVGALCEETRVLFHEYGRHTRAPSHRVDHIDEVFVPLLIEQARRLVHDQHIRFAGDGRADGDTLHLTGR